MTKRFRQALIVGLFCLLLAPLVIGPAPVSADPGGAANRLQRVPPQPDGLTVQYQPRGLRMQDDNSPRDVLLKMRGEPLARVYAARKAAGPGLMGAALQRRYVQRLELAQRDVVAGAKALGVPVITTYQKVLNGVQVRARPAHFDALLALPGVEAVVPIPLMEFELGDSVPYIGAQQVIDELGIDGTGVDIAVIDTGVDYLHADFGGPGTQDAYDANDSATIDDEYEGAPLFPTAKVVGGYDFVGDRWDPACSEEDEEAGECSSTPEPDPDPMDFNGHGTHVAGIAAGIGSEEVPHGVAPGARIWALKTGSGLTNSIGQAVEAFEWALDPNDDGDMSDALDVVNMSFGSVFSGGGQIDVYAEAIENAVSVGMVAVAAAGNAGDVPFIVDSPAAVPEAIGVASSYAPGEVRQALEVTEPDSIAGQYEIRTANFGPSLEEAGSITDDVAYAEPNLACESITNAEEVADKIALIDRGECTFVTKVRNAQNAGAVAVIIVDDGRGIVGMADDGTGGDITIPSVMISQSDGELVKDELPAVRVTLSADIEIPRPDLTDTLSGFSSRGPGARRPTAGAAADGSPTVFKPEVAAPGSNIVSARAGSGTEGVAFSGTSMATPHLAGVAALIKQAHPDWTPEHIKAAIASTAKSPLYDDGNPEFGGGGTVAPATRMGAGLVDVFAAITSDVSLWGDQAAAVDFGFHSVSEPMSLTRDVTIQNAGDTALTYDVDFAFQDADDEDAGVTFTPSLRSVTVPASGTATVELTVDIDPAGLKDWPLRDQSTGSGDALRDIEYSGWLTFTPSEGAVAPEARPLPVYLLARKSANPAASLQSAPTEFGSANGGSVEITNGSPVPSTAEVFTLAGLDPNEEQSGDAIDMRAVGVRNTPVEGLGNVLEFAFASHAPRIHPIQLEVDVFIDVNQDREPDFLLLNNDLSILLGQGCCSGQIVTALVDLTTGQGFLEFFVQSDLFTTNLDLPVLAEDMGLGEDSMTFDYWVAVFDNFTGDLVDVLPEGAFESPAHYTFDGATPLYVIDQASVEVVDSRTISFYADPFGAIARPSAEGLLVLYDSSATDVSVDPVEVDFEFDVQELAIEADRAATGYVDSRDVLGASLGGSPLRTGVTDFSRTRWYGVTQFDLASDVPSNAHIVEAQLDLIGQESRYLDEDAQADWMVEVLDEGIDSAWPDVKYYQIRRAGVESTLTPIRDAALAEGEVNVFEFSREQTALLEGRLATTGRVSLRTNMELDRLSQFVQRHLYAWDGGGGARVPGEQPPVLHITHVSAR